MKRFREWGMAALFAAVIFLGAFLLFQVQPLIGRYLLPWFGGAPEVWTACMLFFQVFLLAGYAYAHWLTQVKSWRRQAAIHVALLAAALLFLPVFPHDSFKPAPGENPILKILLICAVTVGLPYLVLSATSPLVQGWFARRFTGKNPYRLYALSNAGSLLALASFPFVFEPLLTRGQTVYIWSAAFAMFAVLCAIAALRGIALPAENAKCEIRSSKQIQNSKLKTLTMLVLPDGCGSYGWRCRRRPRWNFWP
ncbi:MAG: hypothetical protein LLF76_03885 [Planctomycetaceae bacterium]|nr:hypothetical protein [Planctomycetaceae bacterium]